MYVFFLSFFLSFLHILQPKQRVFGGGKADGVDRLVDALHCSIPAFMSRVVKEIYGDAMKLLVNEWQTSFSMVLDTLGGSRACEFSEMMTSQLCGQCDLTNDR